MSDCRCHEDPQAWREANRPRAEVGLAANLLGWAVLFCTWFGLGTLIGMALSWLKVFG